jgi:hypothetical protein
MISFPANPQIGDLFSYFTRTWIWNGNAWQSAIYRPDGAIVSDVAPSGAKAGWSWWDRINSVLYVYDGAAWVESSQTFRTGDLDAWDYIYRVQAADGQDLEDSVIAAMLKFVIGCKTDGIWDAIKASCVMAGARTLNGALVPLKGTAPTNVNFQSTDYNRKTGLKGDGATKYLNSNRNNNADPQNSKHLYVRGTTDTITSTGTAYFIGASSGSQIIYGGGGGATLYFRANYSTDATIGGNTQLPKSIGVSRSSATQVDAFLNGATVVRNSNSATPFNGNIFVFNGGTSNYIDARIAFYSIGEAIQLSTLDSRISTLMTDLNTAIP